MEHPSQVTILSAFVALWAVVLAVKCIPPIDPFESRVAKLDLGRRVHTFANPAARRGPLSKLSDLEVQSELLNPIRLAYLARALRNTTCKDASSACYSSPGSRLGPRKVLRLNGARMASRLACKADRGLQSRFVDVGCGDGVATKDFARRYGFTMVGIDELDKAVAWAQDSPGEIEGVSFSAGSAYSLPLADRSVDGWVLRLHPSSMHLVAAVTNSRSAPVIDSV